MGSLNLNNLAGVDGSVLKTPIPLSVAPKMDQQTLFKVYAERVLERKRARSAKTYVNARLQINRLIRSLGDLKLGEIDEDRWSAYITEQRAINPRRKSLFDDRKWLNVILNSAFQEGVLLRKVHLFVPEPMGSPGREVIEKELALLLEFASPELKLQIEIAYKMGLRLREMLYLKWDRFDWVSRVIILKPSDTKTRRGRVIPVNDDVFARLKLRHARRRSDFVFPNRFDYGKPQHDNKSAWIRLKRITQVNCRWHDLRHTCATLLLRRGATLGVAKAMLGMSEPVLTRIYQHVGVGELRAAAKLMSSGKE